jgi:hypothetical protein
MAQSSRAIVVSRYWPSMTKNFETPTGTLRAGMVTTAPMKWLEFASLFSRP